MREVLQLPHSKDGKSKTALFEKDKITDLEDSEYSFLKSQDNGPFNFLVKEGTFILVDSDEEEKPPLSKKEQKRLDKAAKKIAEKEAEETKKTRQGN